VSSFLLITDLDNTLVGDDLAMEVLNQSLEKHRQKHDTKIVYSTGRSLYLYHRLTDDKELLEPDILICGVGTEIFYNGTNIPDPAWSSILSAQWDRPLVAATAAQFPSLTLQPEHEQNPFKVSYGLSEKDSLEVLPQLKKLLTNQGLEVQVIYSGGKDLDLLPHNANKGMAMTYVRQALNIDPLNTVACGDSGNDLALFENREERGIIVGNAKPELLNWHYENPNPNRYLARDGYAKGMLEGLEHFGFLHNT
jgi:sucrose-6F-phosphate phosphohydrolase